MLSKLAHCTESGWDGVNFLHSSLYDTVTRFVTKVVLITHQLLSVDEHNLQSLSPTPPCSAKTGRVGAVVFQGSHYSETELEDSGEWWALHHLWFFFFPTLSLIKLSLAWPICFLSVLTSAFPILFPILLGVEGSEELAEYLVSAWGQQPC